MVLNRLYTIITGITSLITITGGSLLLNYLTMGTGSIWYNYFGNAQWETSYFFKTYAIPVSFICSIIVASIITIVSLLSAKYLSKRIYGILLISMIYLAGFLYTAVKVSESYIVEFGNTWTGSEIFCDIVFLNPVITFSIILSSLCLVIISYYIKPLSLSRG